MRHEVLADLIGAAYEAVFERDGWASFLRSLIEALDLAGGIFRLYDRPNGAWKPLLAVDSPEARGIMDEYLDLQLVSPHVPQMEPPPGQGLCALSRELVPDEVYRASDIYNVIVKPRGLFDDIGLWIPVTNGLELRGIFYREPGRAGCGREGVRALSRLAPHLARAAKVQLTLGQTESEERALERCLDRLGQGVILTNEQGLLIWANGRAETTLREHGVDLFVRQKRLVCRSRDGIQRLRSLLARAAQPPNSHRKAAGGTMAIRRGFLTSPLTAHVVPLGKAAVNGAPERASVAILVTDPTAMGWVSEALLRELFDLTPAEARVAKRIAAGASLKQIAETLDVSSRTVQNQLGAAFAKTGTSRQAELVREVLLRSLPAVSAEDCEGS